MKKLYLGILVFCCFFLSFAIKAQSPQAISFQSIIRNNNSTLMVNAPIGMRISIIKGSSTGNTVYTETHQAKTDAKGLLNFAIGKGITVFGNFNAIEWGKDSFYMKTESDINGGNNYQLVNTQKFQYVPYALYAEKGGTPGAKGKDGISILNADLQNDSLVFLLSDNSEVNAGKINGDNSVFIANAKVMNDSLILVLSDSNKINAGRVSRHYVGEVYGGGVVFHVFNDRTGQQHGLIVGLDDLSYGSAWSNVDNVYVGLDPSIYFDGKTNTQTIINQAGHQYSAALLCDSSTAYGYSDWYLPSSVELEKLFESLIRINFSLTNSGGSPLFYFYSYWTSNDSKTNYDYAWSSKSNYSSVNQISGKKKSDTDGITRAIRAF